MVETNRKIILSNDSDRFKLKKNNVNINDIIYITSTQKTYVVIDKEKLNEEKGYSEYSEYLKSSGGIIVGDMEISNYGSIILPTNSGLNFKSKTGEIKPLFYIGIDNNLHINNLGHSIVFDADYLKLRNNTIWNESNFNPKASTIPAPQSPNNAIFLRNDNTWAVVTPENIGAQPKGKYAQLNHSHDYLSINGGTLNGNLTGKSDKNISGFGKVYNAVWNDYAEFFERGEETEPGDIIALDTNSDKERYVKATANSNIIVGVHSDSFAHLIGGENPPDNEDFYEYNIKRFIPVGLAGRVKVKVIGPVKKGDYIALSDIPGVGISIQQYMYKQGFVSGNLAIGRTLENKDTEDIGLVKILIR